MSSPSSTRPSVIAMVKRKRKTGSHQRMTRGRTQAEKAWGESRQRALTLLHEMQTLQSKHDRLVKADAEFHAALEKTANLPELSRDRALFLAKPVLSSSGSRSDVQAGYERHMKILDEEVQRQLEAYARPSCMAFSRRVHAVLARELRDQIYEFLLPDDQRVFFVNDMEITSTRTFAPGLPKDQNCVPWYIAHKLLRDAHYLKPHYVESVVKSEILATWYRRSTFSFTDLSLVDGFLEWDDANPLPNPRNVVTNIKVHVRESEFLEAGDGKAPASSGIIRDDPLDEPIYDGERHQQVLAKLEELFKFKPGTRISFSFIVNGKYIYTRNDAGINALLGVFAAVLPTLRRLQEAGYFIHATAPWCLINSRLDEFSEEKCYEWIQQLKERAKETRDKNRF